MVGGGRQKKRRGEVGELKKESLETKKIKTNNKKERVDEEWGNKKEADERAENKNSKKTEGDKEEKQKNITFLVRYGDGRAIPIGTHLTHLREARMPPLETVSDLMEEMKLRFSSRIGSIDTDLLGLYTTEKGVVSETPLGMLTPLISVNPLGTNEDSPLVIKIIGSTQPTFPTSSNNTSQKIGVPLQQLSVSGKLNLCFFSYFIFTLEHWSLCLLIFLKSHTLDVHTLFSSVSNE